MALLPSPPLESGGPTDRGPSRGLSISAVVSAAQAQSSARVLELLQRGSGVDEMDPDGNTALHWAVWHRMEELTDLLLERGAQPHAGNASGETPLHWAAKSSFVAGLGALSQRDSSLLSMRDCDGFTPFIISAQNDNAPVMEWMYMQGVSVEEQDDLGRTALQWACYKGHRRSVQWLLSRSASIVHRDQEGMTALHWAALKGHEQVADMLLEVGAARLLRLPDIVGDTPIAMAWRKGSHHLLFSFCKAACLQAIAGRSSLARNNLADLFVFFLLVHLAVFALVLAPALLPHHAGAVACWSALICAALGLWARSCFSDPGWIRPRTVFPQKCSIDEPAPEASGAEARGAPLQPLAEGAEVEDLPRLELEQVKLSEQRRMMDAALDEQGEEAPSAQAAAREAWRAQLDRASKALQEREKALCDSIRRARREHLLDRSCDGGAEYLSLLDRSEFKKICVVCRALRTLRSHHCKECGRCVDRLDHHCPWIDNCVGIGNQRSFYCFIVVLMAAIADLYYLLGLYFVDEVLPWISSCSIRCFANSLTMRSLGPAVHGSAALTLAVLDLVWLAFVGMLVVRQTLYVAVNLTTFEVLVRPSHVQQRFPEGEGRFWFLRDLGAQSCLGNCGKFWTSDASYDMAGAPAGSPEKDFAEPASPDVLRSGYRGCSGHRCLCASSLGSPEQLKKKPPPLHGGGPQLHLAPCTPVKCRYL